MLIHDFLEEEHLTALKVTLNLLMRVEQHLKEDKVLGSQQISRSEEDACFVAEPIFQRISTLDQLDKVICADVDRESMKDIKHLSESKVPALHQAYLSHSVFRKTYFAAKKEIDEWLRADSYQSKQLLNPKYKSDITMECLKQQQQVKELTRNFVRQLKNPDTQANGEQKARLPSKMKQTIKTQKEHEIIKPSLEIDTN